MTDRTESCTPEDRRLLDAIAEADERIQSGNTMTADEPLTWLDDVALAARTQRHITSRGGSKLPGGAWAMMLEAARRLAARGNRD